MVNRKAETICREAETIYRKAGMIYGKAKTIYRWQETISHKATQYLAKKLNNSSNDISLGISFKVKSC